MKHLLTLLIGVVVGALIFVAGLYYNPLVGRGTVSPLAVTQDRIIELSYSAVPSESILYTNDGESTASPSPERVGELWEPAIADTEVLVTQLQNSRGMPVGLGIKFTSKSEASRLFRAEALNSSVWHIYLPNQGTLAIDQTENLWTYLRDVVVPARIGSGDNWRGTYHQITTVGPGSLGTAKVTGGSGLFSGLNSESVESVTASAYSAQTGPVAINGNLTIAIPNTQ